MEKSFAVKALQITPESVEECLRLVRGSAEMDREQGLVLHTPYGKKIARYGDWIVELAHGGFDVHKDEPQEDQIDSVLRSFGYDPVLIGLRGKVFAEVCLENMRLKQRIMELEDEIERRRKSHELSLDALMKANLEAEIVATLLILTPEERTEVANAVAAQDSTTASDLASRLLNACYEKRQRADVQRMVRSALTVPTVTDEEADIDKQLKLA